MGTILSNLIRPRRRSINSAVVTLYHRDDWPCQVDKVAFLYEQEKAEPKLQSVFWEIDVFMLKIVVSFLIRSIGQHQKPNYPYSTHYRRNISPHRSRGLQKSHLEKMFFCTGCMEVLSWLYLRVVS